jgi:dTMP kinase
MTGQPPGRPGVFVSVDGPGGVGKSTVVALVAEQLTGHRLPVHQTTEPSRTELGRLLRAGTDTYTGMALACLCAGDRHHQLSTVIRPQHAAGAVVLSDRYLPSSLVLQRMDGLDWNTICRLNAGADQPDLSVILNADPPTLAARLAARGRHSRFERLPGSSRTEADLYTDTAARLAAAGWPVHTLDATTATPQRLAAIVTDRILAVLATTPRSADDQRWTGPADVQHRQPVAGTGETATRLARHPG